MPNKIALSKPEKWLHVWNMPILAFTALRE